MKYVLVVSKNLIVSDRIGSIARSYGFDVVARTGADAVARAKLSRPVLIVVDIEENKDFLAKLKAANISSAVLGFYPHKIPELKEAAKKLGYQNIFPNSLMEKVLRDFLTQLTNI